MEFYGRVPCGLCGVVHRVQRSLIKDRKYRFRCQSCGFIVLFNMSHVRWAFEPEQVADDGKWTACLSVKRARAGEIPRRTPAPHPPARHQQPSMVALDGASSARGRAPERLPRGGTATARVRRLRKAFG